jgi:hypothetical protein
MKFQHLLIAIAVLILPAIGVSYLVLRRRSRQAAYLALFTHPDVGIPYLASQGHGIKREKDETKEAHWARVRAKCTEICLGQFKGEFGTVHWVLPLLMATVIVSVAWYVLVTEGFGTEVIPPGSPTTILFALLGAMVWSFYVVIRDYTRSDLSPAAFYWISFRFILAIALAILATRLFSGAVVDVGAFVLATLPFDEGIRFIRSHIPGLAVEEATPRLTILQGLSPENAERLRELGVQTIEQLAYADPLRLLLGSNFPPKVLIDWMDQALLYLYLGERVSEVRRCGIRGAIELAALEEAKDTALDGHLAARVGIEPNEFSHLVKTLDEDTQATTLLRLWGTLDPES